MEYFEMLIRYKGNVYLRVEASSAGRCSICPFKDEPLCKEYSEARGNSALCNLGVEKPYVGGYFELVEEGVKLKKRVARILRTGDVCESDCCTNAATSLVTSREADAVLKLCDYHAERTLDAESSEYHAQCDNCGCEMGVN